VYIATQSSSCRAKARRTRPQLTNSNGSSKYGQQWSIMVEATVAPGLDANSSYCGDKMCTKPHVPWICHETCQLPEQAYRYMLIEHMPTVHSDHHFQSFRNFAYSRSVSTVVAYPRYAWLGAHHAATITGVCIQTGRHSGLDHY